MGSSNEVTTECGPASLDRSKVCSEARIALQSSIADVDDAPRSAVTRTLERIVTDSMRYLVGKSSWAELRAVMAVEGSPGRG